MFFLIEIDKGFSLGLDINRYFIGIRLGFIGIHIGLTRFTTFLDAANNSISKTNN